MKFNEVAEQGIIFKKVCADYIIENLELIKNEEITLSINCEGEVISVSKENFSFTYEHVSEYGYFTKDTVYLKEPENVPFIMFFNLVLLIADKKNEDPMLVLDFC